MTFGPENLLTLCVIPNSVLENNPKQQNPLVLAYAKSMMHELITRKKNPMIKPKIMNLIWYIDTVCPKTAEMVTANLPGGPSKCCMQKLNACEREQCILDLTVSHMKARMKDGIER